MSIQPEWMMERVGTRSQSVAISNPVPHNTNHKKPLVPTLMEIKNDEISKSAESLNATQPAFERALSDSLNGGNDEIANRVISSLSRSAARSKSKSPRNYISPRHSPQDGLFSPNEELQRGGNKALKVLGIDVSDTKDNIGKNLIQKTVLKDFQKIALKEAGLVSEKDHHKKQLPPISKILFKRRKSSPSLNTLHERKGSTIRKNSMGSTQSKTRTLREIWEQPIFRRAFSSYLEEHYCSESKQFLEEVDRFENTEDEKKRTSIGHSIVARFFEVDADDQINIDGNTSDGIPTNSFEKAKKVIMDLLEKDVFQRFIQSAEFISLLSPDESNQVIESVHTRNDSIDNRNQPEPIRISDLKYIKSLCHEIHQSMLTAHWVFLSFPGSPDKGIPLERIVVITTQTLFTIQHTILSVKRELIYDILNLEDMTAHPDSNYVKLDFSFRSEDKGMFSLICNYSSGREIAIKIIDSVSACFSLNKDIRRPLFAIIPSNFDYIEEKRFDHSINAAIARFNFKDSLLQDNKHKDILLEKESNDRQRESTKLQETISQLTKIVSSQTQRIVDLSEELNDCKKFKDNQLNKMADVMESQKTQYELELSELKKSNSYLSTMLSGRIAEYSELKKQNDEISKRYEATLKVLNIENDKLKDEVKHTDWRLTRVKRGYDANLKSFHNQCDLLQQENTSDKEKHIKDLLDLQEQIKKQSIIIEEKDRIIEKLRVHNSHSHAGN